MGYVDFQTMMDIRDRLLEKINRENHHTNCSANFTSPSSATLDNPLFKHANTFEEGKTYTFCLGQNRSGAYFYRGNGNGFVASSKDYLHQRKKYTDFTLSYDPDPDSENVPTWYDLFKFLFRKKIEDEDWYDLGYIEDVVRVNKFPGVNKPSPSLQITLGMDPADFYDYCLSWYNAPAEWGDNYIRWFKNHLDASNILTRGAYCWYDGKIYIVEGAFKRENSTLTSPKYFCKSVYGYLHLIISIKNVDGAHVTITIGTLKK